jgi:hypothetical protein
MYLTPKEKQRRWSLQFFQNFRERESRTPLRGFCLVNTGFLADLDF